MSTVNMVSILVGAAPGLIAASTATVTALRWRRIACMDALTRIPNRRGLRRLARIVRKKAREGQPVAVAVVDLAKFKAVNDTFGHDTGDAVLAAVAKRLTDQAVVAGCVRLGGDEFAAALTPRRGCEWPLVIDVVSRWLSAPLTVDGQQLNLNARLGAATATGTDHDLSQLLAAADAAMYAARRNNRTTGLVHGGVAVPARPRVRARDDHDITIDTAVAA
ncbi:GGDEF domain-containing protein [Stackebrandtia nassauensis]|uniref:Diguanylate cyclase n=1 Tax=Stackebrandtia nassauensis (strain DSM 44728 / CIP 108903 / NRRL B-16338 / NBRC 102104 / LLR-40K-21) TaxID=446470 RepID=D3Q382_STANL|nr:GGDEF domain-containing protein [Stackebrandtia nassauensis]ADD40052.1 diguanylate cyclase [Stackebrandtia nassauensis DSM 44728]